MSKEEELLTESVAEEYISSSARRSRKKRTAVVGVREGVKVPSHAARWPQEPEPWRLEEAPPYIVPASEDSASEVAPPSPPFSRLSVYESH